MIKNKLKELEKLFQNQFEELPEEGFKTRAQWELEFKISEKHCSRILKRYVSNGMMETKSFKTRNGLVFRKTPHYRIITKCRDKK